jgi:hypothetical protein
MNNFFYLDRKADEKESPLTQNSLVERVCFSHKRKIVFLISILLLGISSITNGQPANYYMNPTFGSAATFNLNSPVNGIENRTIQATSVNNSFYIEWDSQWNEWYNTSINLNQEFTLTWHAAGGLNNTSIINTSATVGRYYTIQIAGLAYSNRQAVLMETDNTPQSFHATSSTAVSTPSAVYPGQDATINITLAGSKSAQEKVFVRYTLDNWSTWKVVEATGIGSTWSTASATIPASDNTPNATIKYYAYTTTVSATNSSNHDLITLKLGNNGGSNYTYTVASSWITNTDGNWSSTTTWLGNAIPASGQAITIAHNVVLDQNSSVSSLTINASKSLTINVNQSLTVTGTLTNNAGSTGLIIASDATGTGSLIHNTAGVSGTVQRYMNNADWTNWQDGWHFISSPVSAQSINPNFTGAPYDFYCWYELSSVWVNYKNTTEAPTWNTANDGSTNFIVGRGYMAAYDNGGTKEFGGTLNVADVTFTNLSYTAGASQGYHLFGNPFSSAIIWYTDWTVTNFGGVAQIWNEAGLAYTPITTGDIIPATQGFMAQVTNVSNSVTIPSAKRTHSAQAFYKQSEYPIIKLFAKNLDDLSYQESQIRFNPASTEDYDYEFDGEFLPGYAPLFYSSINEKNLIVNSLPSINLTTSIPFHFIKNEGDNFSINAVLENVSETVYLLDKKTSIDHNLSTNPVYTFTASTNDDPNRFEIHFGVVGINESNNENSLNAYVYGDKLYVMNTSGKANIQLFDLQGRLVQSSVLNGTGLQSQSVNLPAGVYVVRVNDEKSVKSVKLVIE